jgi:hypothetical protein
MLHDDIVDMVGFSGDKMRSTNEVLINAHSDRNEAPTTILLMEIPKLTIRRLV